MSYLCAVLPSESRWTLTVIISRRNVTFFEADATIFARFLLETKFNCKYLKTKFSRKYLDLRKIK
jgi:hypothetical protein